MTPNKQHRVMVTGGAGFLGCHLIAKLLEQGHDVLCVDSFLSGNRQNVLNFAKHPNFELMRHDVTREFTAEVDQIYHLACPASPVHYQLNPIKTMKTSVVGTLNVLGIARRNGAKVLFTSTSEVYGEPLVHPQTEEYYGNVNPCGLRSCYDEGKRAAEALCVDYHRQHGVEICIARVFNTYGPRMCPQDGRVVSNFIVQALQGKPLTIYGTGQQSRSFCFVSDLVDGLIALMNADVQGPINLGNPTELTIGQIAEEIRQRINPDLPIKYGPRPADDPTRRQPDITKAKKLLGWEPKVSFSDGIGPTIEYFKEQLKDGTHLYAWDKAAKQYEESVAATIS